MGVSQVVAYVLLFFITISLGLIALGAYIKSQQLLLRAEDVRQSMELDQLNTRIFVKSVVVNGNLLYITITNNGSTVLYDFKDFTIIIKYYANISNISTLIISNYNYSTILGPYKWISNTVLINPNMVGTFIADLPYSPYPNTEATIVVVTNYGPKAIWRGIL
ncbi:flagellar protein F [Sulfolobus sp. E5-1-F]|uniref:flagellar protein F n=1 Tax=Sulfolobaceae TaxID=118883 RepID=UPI001296D734|nr:MULTISPECIES: flagellar protein F [unclassified Sulfolobus]QGA53472.1 flagellar protein F [Sulfolobus sp. E5-1-F]QGA68853.1 flagellar protein F [Sulfolobus sp. E11-6]